MGGQQRPYDNFQQKGFQNIHGNYNQAGDNKPQQRQNLWDHIAKLEESLTKLTEVIITNHKNREAIIKTKPYACDPSSLPIYPPSKEIDAKNEEESRR